MEDSRRHGRWGALLAVALAAGCGGGQTSGPAPAEEHEGQVRLAFADLQAALQLRDADLLWGLMDDRGRADADRAAEEVRSAYGEADAGRRARLEGELGLPGAELATLTGKGFLTTERFQAQYREVPDGTVEEVTVEGDRATVRFLGPGRHQAKVVLVRREGGWKVSLTVPRGGGGR
jgi:hypothetical protein